MNRLPFSKQVAVVAALVEGNSIHATSRMTGVAKGTILTLLEDIGTACAEFHNRKVRNARSRRIQCDEIWQFCYAKENNVPADKKGHFGCGDVWTWTAVDADTKLTIAYLVGKRDAGCAFEFIQDLASRLVNRVQLRTHGLKVYLEAVEGAFGCDVDYACQDLWESPRRGAVQSSSVPGGHCCSQYGPSRPEPYFDELH